MNLEVFLPKKMSKNIGKTWQSSFDSKNSSYCSKGKRNIAFGIFCRK
jgi:hypothetical protein